MAMKDVIRPNMPKSLRVSFLETNGDTNRLARVDTFGSRV